MNIFHNISSFILRNKIIFKDVLNDGNAVVATLSNLSHTVLIYAFENYKFKVKDSHGKKYEIPIDRPDSIQVCEKHSTPTLSALPSRGHTALKLIL